LLLCDSILRFAGFSLGLPDCCTVRWFLLLCFGMRTTLQQRERKRQENYRATVRTLGYAIVPPGRNSAFRAGFRSGKLRIRSDGAYLAPHQCLRLSGSLAIRSSDFLVFGRMINLAPGLWQIFGPLGPTAGPGSLGMGPGSKNSAGCTKSQPRRLILSPIRGHFCVFGADRIKIK
jgi:hypothetical protein